MYINNKKMERGNKLKKTLGIILVALIMLMALAACGDNGAPTSADTAADDAIAGDAIVDEKTTDEAEAIPAETIAFQAYTDIMNRMDIAMGESGAFDIDVSMVMEMDFMGESIVTVMSGNMTMIVDGDAIQSHMIMVTEVEGVEIDMEIFMVLEGESLTEVRVIMDGEEIPAEMLGLDMIEDMFENVLNMPDAFEEMFSSVEITEVGNNTVITTVMCGELLGAFAADMIEDQLAMLGPIDFEMSVEDIHMEIVVDSNDIPVSMTMDMVMEIEVEGESMTMSVRSEYTFNSFDIDEIEVAA